MNKGPRFTLEDLVFARAVFTWAAKRRHAGFTWHQFNICMRSVLHQQRLIISCRGKEVFDSMETAQQVAGRPRRRDNSAFAAYRCRCCRKYHVAHRDPAARKRKALATEKAWDAQARELEHG